MSAVKEQMNVIIFAITHWGVIIAIVVDQGIDYTVMAPLVTVGPVAIVILMTYDTNFLAYGHADIDECVEDIDDCAQNCTDTDGSYVCSCDIRYRLANDSHGCNGGYPYRHLLGSSAI